MASRGNGLRRLAFAALAGWLALMVAGAAPAFAKDYHIKSLDVRAVVVPDGSMDVVERREVDFSGNFHWAQWALDTAGSEGIELAGLTGPGGEMRRIDLPEGASLADVTPDPGTYLVSTESSRIVVKVGFDVTDQVVPFTVRYRVKNAAKRFSDTAELYWMFVGSETGVVTDVVHIDIGLPPAVSADQVKAWAHGPLNGVVAIKPVSPSAPGTSTTGAHVTLDVTDLPPNKFVEGRVLFPASALSEARPIPKPRLQEVMTVEGRLADEANARRTAARTQMTFAWLGGFGVPLLLLGLAVWMYFRFGREYKPEQYPGGYYRDIPAEIPPALVGSLWRMGQPDDAAVGATLMNLGLQRVVTMKPVSEHSDGFLGIGAKDEQTYELGLDRSRLDAPDPLERDLVTFLFDDTMQRDSFTIDDLRDEAKAHPQDFTRGLAAWKGEVKQRADDLGWFETSGTVAKVVTFLLGAVAAIAAIMGIAAGGPWLVLALIPAALVLALGFFMSRRSREAVELYAKYRGLRDYLRDFSRLDEAPPAAVILWEKYLVLAVVFGIADEVIAQMRVAVPDVVNDPAFGTAYWWAYSSAGTGSPVSAVTGGISEAMSAATSAMSSSSGGGGGFSGGGGGGGGGGGFSAG